MTINQALKEILQKQSQDSNRLAPLADYVKDHLHRLGLKDVRGGSAGELQITGYARSKDWDVAYDYAGKPRLLISLKSIWKNASGSVPNRLDDLMGEAANVQQMSPEVVTGYVFLFDVQADSTRKEDNQTWSSYFEQRIAKLCVRKAPMWNQGLIEGAWFIRFDSSKPLEKMIVEPGQAKNAGKLFFEGMLSELTLREPAIPRGKITGDFQL